MLEGDDSLTMRQQNTDMSAMYKIPQAERSNNPRGDKPVPFKLSATHLELPIQAEPQVRRVVTNRTVHQSSCQLCE